MSALRQSRWLSTFFVAVIALAWLGASSHCAFAALEGVKNAGHACCHEPTPVKPQSSTATPCCVAFNVPIPASVAVPVAQVHALPPLPVGPESVAAVLSVQVSREAPATGPPPGPGFVEIVLNRSLLSHAPPVFVS